MNLAHSVFETLGWVVGYLLYRRQRLQGGDVISGSRRRWVTTAAVLGALIGARLLHLLEDPAQTARFWTDPMFVAGGKTIVGGFIGAIIAVELTKKRLGITTPTGDVLAVPICVGVAVGRVGCFLAGLADGTFGNPTTLAWGVDFGDGVARHPTQLYEIAFVLMLAGVLIARRLQLAAVTGDAFKLTMVGYFLFRLTVDFLKPEVLWGGMSAIQWASLAALAFYAPHIPRLFAEVRHA